MTIKEVRIQLALGTMKKFSESRWGRGGRIYVFVIAEDYQEADRRFYNKHHRWGYLYEFQR